MGRKQRTQKANKKKTKSGKYYNLKQEHFLAAEKICLAKYEEVYNCKINVPDDHPGRYLQTTKTRKQIFEEQVDMWDKLGEIGQYMTNGEDIDPVYAALNIVCENKKKWCLEQIKLEENK